MNQRAMKMTSQATTGKGSDGKPMLELVDTHQKEQVGIGMNTSGAGVTFVDRSGAPRVHIGVVEGESGIQLLDKDGTPTFFGPTSISSEEQ